MTLPQFRFTAAIPAALLACVSLTACGGGGDGSAVKISADESALEYDPSATTAGPGETTIEFDNPAPLPHDLVLNAPDGTKAGETEMITGSDASFDVNLTPGTYTFYCSVPGHEEGGMKGTLTVAQ